MGTNGGAAIYNYGIVEVNGGTFTSIGGYSLNNQLGASMTVASGVTANNGIYSSGATLTINGGEISGNRSGCHVVYAWNSDVTINGGTFYNYNSGNATVMAEGSTTMTINDGTFGIKDGRVPGNGNTWTSCLLDTSNSAVMTINGGTFNGGVRVKGGTKLNINAGSFNDCTGSNYNVYDGAVIVIKGGIFTDNTAANFAKKYVAEGYEAEKVDGAWVVSEIKDILVSTFDELKAAIVAGGKIKLVNDIEVSETIAVNTEAVLNLNGYNITAGYQAGSTTKHLYPFDVYGTLTIMGDGSISGRGMFVQEGSKLILEGGSIYGIDSNGGSAIFQYGGDVIVNGGHIEQKAEGTYNFAINGLGGTVTVNGGWIGGNHGAIATEAASVIINDGELVCTGTSGMTDNVLYSYSNGSIVINGGSFTADNDIPVGGCCIYDTNGKVTVNGGTFGNSSGGDVWGTTGTTIKGGTFENLIEKGHIADGYEAVSNADGSVTITKK